MPERRFIRLLTAVVWATILCLTAVQSRSVALESATRSRQQTPGSEQKTAEQVYKNIKVLNGLPASELDGVMYFMSAALGVGCTHCHTNLWDSDEKSTKPGARRMIVMTPSINKENFNGIPAITCYSCHRGQHNTEPVPPADLATTPAPDATLPPSNPAPLPSTDELIARYRRAIGADAAIEELKTRVSLGVETTTDRMNAARTLPIEIVQAAPDKLLIARKDP